MRDPKLAHILVCLVASDSARREDHFQKKNCPKRTFPSNFVKLVSKILYLFLAEKWSFVVLLFCFVCCNTLSDFGLLFLKTLFKGKNFAVRRVREG